MLNIPIEFYSVSSFAFLLFFPPFFHPKRDEEIRRKILSFSLIESSRTESLIR